ncbi:MAG: hypothetical protein K5655_04435 [Lachnospiraceae bacterium]|nr:hypothetical protein [Lachnospiraceae bacterium]
MFIYDNEYFFDQNINRICFLIDDESDLAYLPTTTSYGNLERAGGDNVIIEPVDAGSMAHSIATSKKYILNSNNEWIEFKPPGSGGGGGGSATNLSDLEDVSLSTPSDGDFLVYNPILGKWINKEADTVVVNYTMIDNKPTINGVTIDGDITSEDLGLENPLTPEQLDSLLDLI